MPNKVNKVFEVMQDGIREALAITPTLGKIDWKLSLNESDYWVSGDINFNINSYEHELLLPKLDKHLDLWMYKAEIIQRVLSFIVYQCKRMIAEDNEVAHGFIVGEARAGLSSVIDRNRSKLPADVRFVMLNKRET